MFLPFVLPEEKPTAVLFKEPLIAWSTHIQAGFVQGFFRAVQLLTKMRSLNYERWCREMASKFPFLSQCPMKENA